MPLRPIFSSYRPKLWYFSIVELGRRSLLMSCPVLLRWIGVNTSLTRLVFGSIFAFVVLIIYRELAPYTSTGLSMLSTVANLQVRARFEHATLRLSPPLFSQIFLVYFGALLLVVRRETTSLQKELDSESSSLHVSEDALGWTLMLVSFFVSLAAAWLQAMFGSSQQEAEQAMLEYAAREADLTLSTQELRSDLEKLARPFGFEKDMALEDKGQVEIRKGIFLHARVGLKWTTGGEVSQMSRKQTDREFRHASFPCFGPCCVSFCDFC